MAYDNSDKPGSTEPDRNPDPITGAPGSHPLGTGIGTTSGALTGAAIGAIGGPVGAAIGIIAGGIVGAITGHKAGEYNDPTEDYSASGQTHADPVAATTNRTGSVTGGVSSLGSSTTGGSARSAASTLDADDAEYWRSTHASNRDLAAKDADFDSDYAPAYGFGTEVSRHAAQSGSSTTVDQLDTDLRTGWDKVRGTSKLSYDQAKPAIAEAFNRTLKLHEERLNVSKDRVQTGDVSIRKEIVTEQKTIEVPVEREEIVITTRSLTGQSATGATIDDGQTIRVPVSEERVSVSKDVVATGEVRLDKKTIQDTKTVVDNLRKETVKVDKTGDVRVNEEKTTGSST